MSDTVQMTLSLLWILACVGGAIYCAVIGALGLSIGVAYASLALPVAMPVMHR